MDEKQWNRGTGTGANHAGRDWDIYWMADIPAEKR